MKSKHTNPSPLSRPWLSRNSKRTKLRIIAKVFTVRPALPHLFSFLCILLPKHPSHKIPWLLLLNPIHFRPLTFSPTPITKTLVWPKLLIPTIRACVITMTPSSIWAVVARRKAHFFPLIVDDNHGDFSSTNVSDSVDDLPLLGETLPNSSAAQTTTMLF